VAFGQRTVPAILTRAVERAIGRGVDVIAYSHLRGPLPAWVNRSTEGPTPDERERPTVRVFADADSIPAERHVVQCPAEYRDEVSCDSCRLCARTSRKSIVAFTAHGSGARKVKELLQAT
jgi:hypothetical protein